MASPQRPRTISTRAQRLNVPSLIIQQPGPSTLQGDAYTHGTFISDMHQQAQYAVPPGASRSREFTPPPLYPDSPTTLRPQYPDSPTTLRPQYPDSPSTMRPVYYENQNGMSAITLNEPYPIKPTERAQDQESEPPRSSRAKKSFWRTRKGILIIVLISNSIILAIVLGVVIGTRRRPWHRQGWNGGNWSGAGTGTGFGSGSFPASPSADSHDSGPAPSSTPIITSSSSTPTSTSFVSTASAVAATPSGASQAGTKGSGAAGEGPRVPPDGRPGQGGRG